MSPLPPLDIDETGRVYLGLNTAYTVTGNSLYVSFKTGYSAGSSMACTWFAS